MSEHSCLRQSPRNRAFFSISQEGHRILTPCRTWVAATRWRDPAGAKGSSYPAAPALGRAGHPETAEFLMVKWGLVLAQAGAMADNSVVVRCGRCGREVTVALVRLLCRRTFDCDTCEILPARTVDADGLEDVSNEDAVSARRAVLEINGGLTQRERSMLARKIVGFSDAEVIRAFGGDANELRGLLARVLFLSRRRP